MISSDTDLPETITAVTGPSLVSRLSFIVGVLLAAMFADSVLQKSLAEVAGSSITPLQQPLKSFPETIGEWIDTDMPVACECFLYADDHRHRTYVNRRAHQTAIRRIIYTKDGRERRHNPEVCMRSAGCQEALNKRTTVDFPGEVEPPPAFTFDSKVAGAANG